MLASVYVFRSQNMPPKSSRRKANVTRSSNQKQLQEVTFKPQNELDSSQLPTKKDIIERMTNLVKEQKLTRDVAAHRCATELTEIWISSSVYPMAYKNVKRKVRKAYDTFVSLTAPTASKYMTDFDHKVNEFMEDMSQGFDVRTKDSDRCRTQENEYSVHITEEDNAFYEDNCHGPRKMFNGPVDKDLKQKLLDEKKRSERLKRQQKRESAEWSKDKPVLGYLLDEELTQSGDISPL